MVPSRSTTLQHIFDTPSTSWNHNNHLAPVRSSSFLNALHEPRFMEISGPVQPATINSMDETRHHQCKVGMNAESLSMCTEGLGSESFVAVDDHHGCFDTMEKHAVSGVLNLPGESKRGRIRVMEFPPPISSIGLNGKPWVCLESYRSGGRFVLKEVRIPNQELLQACREDGRLKLQFVQSENEDEDEDVYIHNKPTATVSDIIDFRMCGDGKPLVMSEGNTFKHIEALKARVGNRVKLTADTVGSCAGKVQKERDAVRTADELEAEVGDVIAEENGIVCDIKS
ncbi:hypothetical protein SSX86_019590 [Deinandra increscens subsp. villosa]|uniref:FAF domain-containing protein n=1 Tax=Deinandra increscens subsp. villosa TaxID=3103831 RepID=A0AAP0CT45_9ASTR